MASRTTTEYVCDCCGEKEISISSSPENFSLSVEVQVLVDDFVDKTIAVGDFCPNCMRLLYSDLNSVIKNYKEKKK